MCGFQITAVSSGILGFTTSTLSYTSMVKWIMASGLQTGLPCQSCHCAYDPCTSTSASSGPFQPSSSYRRTRHCLLLNRLPARCSSTPSHNQTVIIRQALHFCAFDVCAVAWVQMSLNQGQDGADRGGFITRDGSVCEPSSVPSHMPQILGGHAIVGRTGKGFDTIA